MHGGPSAFRSWRSAAILDEIGRVLRYPRVAVYHRWSEERLQLWLEDFAYVALMTPGTLRLAVIQEDPADKRYVECAVEGGAAYLVSGDRLLLALGAYQGIQSISPRVFLEVLQR